jgi:hypothetical protein
VLGSFFLQLLELSMKVPMILVLGRWRVNHSPNVFVTLIEAYEVRQQLFRVNPVRLRTTTVSAHFHACRVNDE